MAGFSPSKKENKLGLRASETASVVFEDCYVPDENRLGDEGQGFVNAMEVLDGGRISIAALAVGIAQVRMNLRCDTPKERQQFGNRFPSFRLYSLSWRTWRCRSTLPVCVCIARRG